MKSMKEQRDIIDAVIIRHGVHTMESTPEIIALIEASANLLDWAERARAQLEVTRAWIFDSIGKPYDVIDLQKLLEELPE